MGLTRHRFIVAGFIFALLLGCASSREIRLGDQFAREGNWEGAVVLYQEAARKDLKDLSLRQKLNEAKAQAAGLHYQKGRELLKGKNLPQALEEFKRAMSLDPAKQEHQKALNEALRLQEAVALYATGLKLMKAERFSEAMEQFEQALDRNPTLVAAQEAIRELSEKQKASLSGEAELTLKSTQPITLKFQNAKLTEVFEFLSKATGINILFDKDVRPETLTVTIFIKNASFKESLSLIMTTNNLFMKKISESTVLIIPKTKQKVDQYQDLLIRTFYLSSTKAEDMVNLLRTMLETRRVYVNKDLNALVLRDTPEKIKLAEKIIEANDRMVAEVMFEVEILEVALTNDLKYGLSFTKSQIQAGFGLTTEEKTASVISLDRLRGGNYTYFFTLPSVIVDFLKAEGEAKTLANPRIRVLDNKQAEITIGEKFPIQISSTVTTAATTTAVVPGQTTTQSTEFKDVAIKLGVKPKVLLNNDVTLELTLDITTLGPFIEKSQQFSFGNRSTKTVLNVKDAETVVISGLIKDEDRVSYNKIPVLGDIPLLGKLFSSTDKSKVKSDILMTITPHVIRGLEAPDKDLQYFWSGTEETYSTKPLFSELPTTGEVRSERPQSFGPEGNAPFPVPPPFYIPPGPVPPFPAVPTPSTLLPRRSFQPALPSAPAATVMIQPEAARIPMRQEVTVGVVVNNATQLSEAILSLAYDPRVLEFRWAAEGDLMGQDGRSTSFVSSTNPSTGLVDIRIKRLADERGINGSGLLVSLVFTGKEAGASSISFKEGHLLNPIQGVLSINLARGQVTVQ